MSSYANSIWRGESRRIPKPDVVPTKLRQPRNVRRRDPRLPALVSVTFTLRNDMRQASEELVAKLFPGRSKTTLQRSYFSWQFLSVTGQAKVGSSTRGANVKVLIEEFWFLRCQLIYSDKEDSFELQSLNISDVKYSNIILLAGKLSFVTGYHIKVMIHKRSP